MVGWLPVPLRDVEDDNANLIRKNNNEKQGTAKTNTEKQTKNRKTEKILEKHRKT